MQQQDHKDTTKFSYFNAPVANCYPNEPIDIQSVVVVLTGDELKKKTEALRAIKSDVDQRKYKAKQFPYVTFSGVFSYRDAKNITYRSQYFCVDADHLDDRLLEVADVIIEEIKPVLMFVSPRGNGLKVVLLIDPNVSHASYFAAFRRFFKEHFDIKIDEACKDVSRACFLCHSPDVYTSEEPTLFNQSFVDSMVELPAPEPLPQTEPTPAQDDSLTQRHPGKTPKDYDYQSKDPRIVARYMIRKAQKGEKHGELIKAAHLLGGLVGAGLITRDEAQRILYQEVEKRKKDIISMEDAYKTIEDGITDGMKYKMIDTVLTGDEPQSEPLPPTQDEPPPPKTPLFPVDAFPDPYADIIRKASELYGTHVDYWAVSFMAALSVAIGRRYMIKTPKYSNSAALWFGIVGPTGNGKTTPAAIMMRELKTSDKESYKKYCQDKQDFDAFMDIPKKERGEDKPPTPRIFQVVLNDFTPEALTEVHDVNRWGLGIYRDELMGWISDIGRYNKSGEVENMLSIWGGESTSFNRTGRVMRIDEPCVTIVGGIQPERLKQLAADGRAHNGLMQRFCFAYPDKTERPDYINDTAINGLFDPIHHTIKKLVHISPYNPTYFNLTSDSLALYQSFYNTNATLINLEASDYVRGIHAKMDIIVLRLALIVCTLNGHTEVDTQDMKSAIRMTEYFRTTATKVNQFIEDNQDETLDKKKVIRYLHNTIGANQSEIGRMFGYDQSYINRVVNRS